MKIVFATILLLAFKFGMSQEWHNAKKSLKLPKTIDHLYPSIGIRDRYDTVSCIYTVAGSTNLIKGYKFVYVVHGFYTDRHATRNVFYDEDMRRVYHVKRYYFD